jgi:hypothetical protein
VICLRSSEEQVLLVWGLRQLEIWKFDRWMDSRQHTYESKDFSSLIVLLIISKSQKVGIGNDVYLYF